MYSIVTVVSGLVANVATCGYTGRTMETGIRELKDNLSRYIRRVEAGQRIAVTAHGRVVAELVPPGAATRKTQASRVAPSGGSRRRWRAQSDRSVRPPTTFRCPARRRRWPWPAPKGIPATRTWSRSPAIRRMVCPLLAGIWCGFILSRSSLMVMAVSWRRGPREHSWASAHAIRSSVLVAIG